MHLIVLNISKNIVSPAPPQKSWIRISKRQWEAEEWNLVMHIFQKLYWWFWLAFPVEIFPAFPAILAQGLYPQDPPTISAFSRWRPFHLPVSCLARLNPKSFKEARSWSKVLQSLHHTYSENRWQNLSL